MFLAGNLQNGGKRGCIIIHSVTYLLGDLASQGSFWLGTNMLIDKQYSDIFPLGEVFKGCLYCTCLRLYPELVYRRDSRGKYYYQRWGSSSFDLALCGQFRQAEAPSPNPGHQHNCQTHQPHRRWPQGNFDPWTAESMTSMVLWLLPPKSKLINSWKGDRATCGIDQVYGLSSQAFVQRHQHASSMGGMQSIFRCRSK